MKSSPMQKPSYFVSIIWGYSTHMYGFAPEENYHLHMLLEAQKAGFTPVALVHKSKESIEADPHFNPAITVIAYKNIWHFLFQVLKFSFKNSVFYVNSYEWQSFLVPFLARRTIFMAHTQPKRNSPIKQRIQNLVYHFFSFIRLNNETEKRFLLSQGIPERKLLVIPLVVSQNIFRILPNKTPRTDMVYFGNVTAKKNLPTLLKAFEYVKKTHPKLKWHIIGNIWDEHFKSLAEHSPYIQDIIFHGFMPNETLVPELNKRLIYINASTDEGQCVAVYDAALSGCLLALPKIMSFVDVFKDTALFHDVYDYTTLGENIIRYLENPESYSTQTRKIQTMITQEYSQKVIERKLQDLLKHV